MVDNIISLESVMNINLLLNSVKQCKISINTCIGGDSPLVGLNMWHQLAFVTIMVTIMTIPDDNDYDGDSCDVMTPHDDDNKKDGSNSDTNL